ncbi:MAG TPA: hypothetical protein C5S37_02215 [Methanophagales archaeon]|nr:hypothetical protein [Methanophagales archaeon]
MIYIRELLWTDWNIEHIIRHNVSPDEVEEVCYSNPFVTKTRNKTLRIIGQTRSGRFLAIFLAPRGKGSYFVVTARAATEAERRRFYK